ncbi:hypothetical protein [Marinivivus vitaminiproducens]|uniref:hypothetical protein n=1 Tax=Marinivivus vitaminiproducens TaxID=3035935 RepID=UPI0027A972C0|nr:hypothetical protein P4R82_21485 [Geminicoccaceae bacterium SCSIO 64248]
MIERFSILAKFDQKADTWVEVRHGSPAPETYGSFDDLLDTFLSRTIEASRPEFTSVPATLTIRMELRVKRPPRQKPIHTNVRASDRNAVMRELSRIEDELRRLRGGIEASRLEAGMDADLRDTLDAMGRPGGDPTGTSDGPRDGHRRKRD